MSNTVVLGLVGPTGAGKSTVARTLEKLGCRIVDCDAVAREVTDTCEPCLEELCREFGADIRKEGQLDRRLLASRAFSTKEKTERLNQITHPWICKKSLERIEAFRKEEAPAVLLDAPLLFEAKMEGICDFILAVVAPSEVRLERILARDGISRELALSRIKAQQSSEYYKKRSDFWLDGSLPMEEVQAKAQRIYSMILKNREEKDPSLFRRGTPPC